MTAGSGEHLLPALDEKNPADPKAILLRSEKPARIVGYVPRYFCADFRELLRRNATRDVVAAVVRVNRDAPSRYRLLCSLTAPWPEGFAPCSDPAFEDLPLREAVARGGGPDGRERDRPQRRTTT